VFVGSEEDTTLEEDMDMDPMFPDMNDANSGTTGAFCVTVKYADIVTGTPEERSEHETSFIYVYTPLLHSLERLSRYNKYT
jgi:hypothetical protein